MFNGPAWKTAGLGMALAVAIAVSYATTRIPELAANGLIRPTRHRADRPMPAGCEAASFVGAGVTLSGWRCTTRASRRGTIVYLHGIADNRGSSTSVIARYMPLGYDVIAYDSRGHGASGGDFCTFGYHEKQDLRLVIDAIGDGPVVLIGASLGAAVALQEAADDSRVKAIVAAETFSDLRTVARERAPGVLTEGMIRQAFAVAEETARFQVDAASPAAAARRIRAAVLLIHGAADQETTPDHSRRVFEALTGRKRLILVPGAHHNESLGGDVWREIDHWIATSVTNGIR